MRLRKVEGVGGDGGLPAYRPAAHPLRGRSRRGRAVCGTRTRVWRSQRAPRTRPARIGEVRVVRRRSGAGGSRAKLRECGPLAEATFRLPQAAGASAPSAPGFAADLGVRRRVLTKAMVDLAGGFCGGMVDLAGGFTPEVVDLAGGFLRGSWK